MDPERDWGLREYSAADKKGVFQLRTAVYGESFNEEDWAWKFESSSLKPARIFLAESQGMIVGLRSFPFREVKVLDDVWLSALAVDGMVHPDFQRRGIWSGLLREGLRRLRAEGIHLAVSFPGTHRHSYAGFCKMGWSDVGSIPLLVKLLRLDGFVSRIIRSPWARSAASRISGSLAGIRRRKHPRRPDDLSIERIHNFDDRFDHLWEEASRQLPASLVRDQKYLEHRYSERPGEKYAVFAACRRRELVGYIVVRRALEMFDLSIGLIMDMLTTGEIDVARFLVHEALDYLDEQGVDAVGCLMMKHSPYFTVLRRSGFFPVPARFNQRDYHLVVEADPSRIPSAVTSDRNNWFLTWGDFDVG